VSLSLDGQGNLVLHTAAGDVLEHAPVIYQNAGGVGGPSGWPVALSHRRAVPSLLAVTTLLPSGLKATRRTTA
jgi:hypothetical protein